MSAAKDRTCGELLVRLAAEFGLHVSADEAAQCCRHLELVAFWNRRVNLTRIVGVKAVVQHVLDSLMPRPWLPQRGMALDMGSGAGFPGIPLAVTCARLHMVLLDADRKKASFLKVCAAELGLRNVSVVEGRLEQWPWKPEVSGDTQACNTRHTTGMPSGDFDLITVRAVRLDEPMLYRLGALLKPDAIVAYWSGFMPPAGVPHHVPLKILPDASLAQGRRVQLAKKGGKTLSMDEGVAGVKIEGFLERLEDRVYRLPGLDESRRLLRWRRRTS